MMDLRLGDCIEGMRGLADKSVDHVIMDPPYGEQIYDNMRSNADRAGPTPNAKRVKAGYEALTATEIESVVSQAARISRRWIVVFMDAESVDVWRRGLSSGMSRHVRTGAFVKLNPMPNCAAWPAQGFDTIEIAHALHGPRIRWNGGGKAAVWYGTSAQADGQEVIHGTQKPLSVMEAIVSDFTDPGELVCDPFAGSGTTAVACKRLGRGFIGWERGFAALKEDEQDLPDAAQADILERRKIDNFAAAVKRIEAAREQFQLPRVAKPKQQRLLP